MRKFLLFVLFVVLVIFMLYKSPMVGSYYYGQAKKVYDSGKYEQSIPLFEKSLFATPNNLVARYYYVLALSKAKPTYSIQKKLYEMGNSKKDDEAKKYARYQAVALRHKLLAGVENNYILNAAQGNDILRWDIKSFPLKVYFENSNSVPRYYISNIQRAMNQWTERTNFVKFNTVQSEQGADIVIRFSDIPSDVCSDGVCKYTVAYTDPVISSDKLLKRMNLTFYKTNPRNENFSELEVYNTALHELGHTLGLMGHSDNPSDLMFSSNENNQGMYAIHRSDFQYLTMRDLKTLALLYRLEPTISNVKNLHSENFYYPPLILGSEDARLQRKLAEFEKYTKEYPTFASGYINLASVYVDMGDFNSALENLNIASSLAKTQDENYLIAYNRAVIYYNMQKTQEAMQYATQAKSIKDDEYINQLISDIQNLK